MNATPVISFENHVTLPLPRIRFKVNIAIIISTTRTLYIENQLPEKYADNYYSNDYGKNLHLVNSKIY